MNEKTLKIAIVGCGNIGKRHIAVVDAEENAEVVAICDIDKDRLIELSDLYNGIPYYTDYDEFLDKCDADIINICTPHGLHCEMSVKASKKKKHVLVEKPMALTSEDCKKMIATANDNEVRLLVVKQNRFNKPIAITTEALNNNKLGKVYMVQCNVIWNRHQEYYTNSDWRGKTELEGGALHTQVSHFIDLLIWWFGDVVEAKTSVETLNHDIEIEDAGISNMKFDSGVMGSLLWTTCAYNRNYEGSITIIGEKGTIKIGGAYLNKIEFWDVQSYPLPEDIDFSDKPNNYGKYQGSSSNHDKLIHVLVENITSSMKEIVEGDEGIKTTEAIELIYNSVK